MSIPKVWAAQGKVQFGRNGARRGKRAAKGKRERPKNPQFSADLVTARSRWEAVAHTTGHGQDTTTRVASEAAKNKMG